jgi:hypothetical protein
VQAAARPTYSSERATRLASVSATPYIATASSAATRTNQSAPAAVTSKWIRRGDLRLAR